MSKAQDRKSQNRKDLVKEINKAASLYRQYLVGKRFLYVFDNRYIEVIYKAQNFRHLTGGVSSLSAVSFYKLAAQGKLAARLDSMQIILTVYAFVRQSI